MGDTIEKTVIDYGNIMALCLVEAGRITSSYDNAPELCRQITHDLFMALTGEARRSAELDALDKLREVAESFKQSDDEIPLQGIVMTPAGPVLLGGASYKEEDSESGERAVPFEPENGE